MKKKLNDWVRLRQEKNSFQSFWIDFALLSLYAMTMSQIFPIYPSYSVDIDS